jgi:Zn finger protein HypA/HybF involved in hydrogenase expression
MIAQLMKCLCGKKETFITDGLETEPCPSCGRRYRGKYSKKKLQILSVELKIKRR